MSALWVMIILSLGAAQAVEPPRAYYRSFSDCPADFHFHTLKFKTPLSPDESFERLTQTAASQMWDGDSQFIQFQNESPEQKKVSRPVQVGDVIELELQILFRLKRMPVYFEVLELNLEARRAVFGYVSSNVTQGVQQIEIVPAETGSTIIHRTCFKSGKGIRDLLYPPVHTSLIKRVYRHLYFP